MDIPYAKRHKLAQLNPYGSVDRLLDADPDSVLVGIKNTATIPNTLMHKLEPHGFSLHTIDRKSPLAGRAVDTGLINPITGHWMSGSSSGTAVNVFAGINDLGIGNDGGGSVLAPAICVNILGFISKLIEPDRSQNQKPNTDGITAGNSLGFMARDREVLEKAIAVSTGITAGQEYGTIWSDKPYGDLTSTLITPMDALTPRVQLVSYLQQVLSQCDVFIVSEGPVDLYGFGDSLFGHFDERTKAIQNDSHKGYVRVCNIAGATALAVPQEGLGMATLLMCESRPDKVSRLLAASRHIPDVEDKLIERYFLDPDSYFWKPYEI